MTVESARPKRADAARNRLLIVEAAREVFGRSGVDASLEEVARVAGVGPGTLYRHFPTRDDLVAAAVTEHAEELFALGDELTSEPAAFTALQRWLRALVAFSGTYGGLSEVAMHAASGAGSDALMAICRPLEERNAAFVQAALDDGTLRPEVTPDDVFVLASAVAWADRYDTDRSRASVRIDTFLRGLAVWGPTGTRA